MPSPEELEELSNAALWNLLPEVDGIEKCFTLREIGRRAFSRRDYAEALTMAIQSASLAEEIEDHRLAAECRFNQAISNYQAGDKPECIQAYELALEQYRILGDQSAMSETLCRISDIQYEIQDYENCLKSATNAYQLGLAEDDDWYVAFAAYYQGKANYKLGNLDLSLQNLETSRVSFRKQSELAKVAMVDDFAAEVQTKMGNHEAAVNLLRSCVHIANATKDTEDDPYAMRRLGDALARVGRFEEAHDFLERAQAEYRSRNYHRTYAYISRDIADNLGELGKYEESLIRFEQAQSLLDSLGDDHAVRYCKMRRSQLLHDMGDFLNAERLSRQVYVEVTNEGSFDDHGYVYWVGLHVADNLLELDRYQELLDLTNELDDSRADASLHNLVWKKTLRARALFALDKDIEALSEAESALALTTNETLNPSTAYLYEIRALVELSKGQEIGERDLAHAIAIHLAAGADNEARALADYFLPKLNPELGKGLGAVDTAISAGELEDRRNSDENGKYQIGFHPTDE